MMSADQLQLLTTPGVLGFYSSCEVTICCLLDRNQTAYNLFTLLTFESRKVLTDKPTFLTNRNEHFGDDLKLVVAQYHITVEETVTFCRQLENGKSQVETELGKMHVSELIAVPQIFVPVDSTLVIPLNRILKNNFRGGSMVLEWFGKKDKIVELIDAGDLQRATLRIRELLPLDLFTISDRIGNILFQLPEQVAFFRLSGKDNVITCSVVLDERVTEPERYCLNVATVQDHIIMGFDSVQGVCRDKLTLAVPDTGGPYVISLTDTKYHIQVLQQTTSMIRNFCGILTSVGNSDTIRVIQLPDGTSENITINSSQRLMVEKPEVPWKEAAQQRHYHKRMDELMHSKEFIRYGMGTNDREKALRDIRTLMNVSPDTIVYLWDPYLVAQDLLETWYFTDTFGLELRAISSSRVYKGEKSSLDDWRTEQIKNLNKGSNQVGINLKWRIQHDQFGFPFHDRFLIVNPPSDAPKAWSLGTSVNSLGKTHHILQAVSNPGYIADAFDELWKKLEDTSCQVWDSQEERRNG